MDAKRRKEVKNGGDRRGSLASQQTEGDPLRLIQSLCPALEFIVNIAAKRQELSSQNKKTKKVDMGEGDEVTLIRSIKKKNKKKRAPGP